MDETSGDSPVAAPGAGGDGPVPAIAPESDPGIDDGATTGIDVVDTNVDRFIDRMVHSAGGAVTGAAMTGLAKGMGLYKEVEETAEIREVGPPEPDEDDPIQVVIDPDHPENTRIVFHLRSPGDGAQV